MNELVKNLRKEAARNAEMQGDKENHTCRRRKTFRYRNHMLTEAANELQNNQASFDLRRKADMRAINRWQEITGEELTWPDHADLVVWLLERLRSGEAKLERTQQYLRVAAGMLSTHPQFEIMHPQIVLRHIIETAKEIENVGTDQKTE